MAKLPGVRHRHAIRALMKLGFYIARESKHVVMTDGSRILTIPRNDPVDAFTMAGIVQPTGPRQSKCASNAHTDSMTASGVEGCGVSIRNLPVSSLPRSVSTGAPLMPDPPISIPRTSMSGPGCRRICGKYSSDAVRQAAVFRRG